jgi:hypothetical protein
MTHGIIHTATAKKMVKINNPNITIRLLTTHEEHGDESIKVFACSEYDQRAPII